VFEHSDTCSSENEDFLQRHKVDKNVSDKRVE